MGIYEEFLLDAIDLHCHIDIEVTRDVLRKREPEWEWLPKAEALGMRGVVLKSHWWPTAVAAPYLEQLYTGAVTVWPSIVLNPVAGGTELWGVEAAAGLGARVIWLPTWGSCNDLEGEGFHDRLEAVLKTYKPEEIAGVRFLDEGERLTPRGHELLHYCADHDLTLASGHVSWQETLGFAREARAIGYERLIFTHPLAAAVQAPLEAAQQAAQLGAWIEVCWTNIQPGRMDPQAAVEWIRAVGVERVVVSTDYFRGAYPNPPELMRMLLGTLYDVGLRPAEIRQVVAINPARALGLPLP